MKIDYTRSIINLTASLFKHYGINPSHPTLKEIDQALEKGYKHVSVILLDGLGTNLLKLHKEDTLFFNEHKVTDIQSVYPSTTAAATTSILTGLTPYESGFFGWFQYFKDEDLHYTIFMDKDYYDEEKVVPKGFFERHFNREFFPEKIEKASGVPGRIFHPEKVDSKNGYKTFGEGLARLRKFQKNHERTISYLYSVEPDLTEHHYGIVGPSTRDTVKKLNDHIQQFAKTVDKDTLLIVTADHGLTDVEPINIFDYHDITSTFKALPANEPRMTNFFIKEGMHEYFIDFFNDHFSDYFTLYTKNEFLTKGMLGNGERHYLIDHCIGDFIAVAHDKYFFKLTDKPDHHAHHAGVTTDEMIVPLIIIEGKGE